MSEYPGTPAAHGSFVVQPKGRLNLDVAPALGRELLDLIEGGRTRIVVNLVDVETVDSSVVANLIRALKLARKAGGDLRIVAPSSRVIQVLTMTNLTRVLPTYPSVDEAFAN